MGKELGKVPVVKAKTAVLQLSDLKVSNLPELQGWKEKQEKLVKDNPYVEIVDNKTYEVACKSRTALLKGRTELQGQDKLIATKLATFRKDVKTETDLLIAITLPSEEKQQTEVKRYEKIKEDEKAEKERIEAQRVADIKAKLDDIETDCYKLIGAMAFDDIQKYKELMMLIFKTEFDFEEYDILFDQLKDRLEGNFERKVESLTEAENQRLRTLELEKEAAESKRLAELQAIRLNEILPYVAFGEFVDLTHLSSLTESAYSEILSSKKALFDADLKEKQEAQKVAEAKAEEEKEKIYEIRKSRLLEAGMQYSDEHDSFFVAPDHDYMFLKEDVENWDAIEFEDTLTEAKIVINDYNQFIAEGGVVASNEEHGHYRPIPNAKVVIEDQISSAVEEIQVVDSYDLPKEQASKYANDKKLLSEFIESLDFQNPVPELENVGMQIALDTLIDGLKEAKESMRKMLNEFQ